MFGSDGGVGRLMQKQVVPDGTLISPHMQMRRYAQAPVQPLQICVRAFIAYIITMTIRSEVLRIL